MGRPLCPLNPDHQRALEKGFVALLHDPAVLRSGSSSLDISVNKLSGLGDSSASISGFLYPMGKTDKGRPVSFSQIGPGLFSADTAIGRDCPYELAVRVMRSGMPTSVVYFQLPIAK